MEQSVISLPESEISCKGAIANHLGQLKTPAQNLINKQQMEEWNNSSLDNQTVKSLSSNVTDFKQAF